MSGCRAPGTVTAVNFGNERRCDTEDARTPGRVRVPRWPLPGAGMVSARNAVAGAVTLRTPRSGRRALGTPGPAGAVTQRTPKRHKGGHQEGRHQEWWHPEGGMCPGLTAALGHLWRMLGSATWTSPESGFFQRHWDPQERLGLGLYLFLNINIVYILNWTFFKSAHPDFN